MAVCFVMGNTKFAHFSFVKQRRYFRSDPLRSEGWREETGNRWISYSKNKHNLANPGSGHVHDAESNWPGGTLGITKIHGSLYFLAKRIHPGTQASWEVLSWLSDQLNNLVESWNSKLLMLSQQIQQSCKNSLSTCRVPDQVRGLQGQKAQGL